MIAKTVPFKAEHLKELLKEDAVAYLRPYFNEELMINMESNQYIHSIELGGKVVFCGGVSMYWPGRGEAWAFFDSTCRKNFVPVFRIVREWIHNCPVRRLEAAVDVGSVEAHRWVQLLGFVLEAPFLKSFRPDGGDVSLYARVK